MLAPSLRLIFAAPVYSCWLWMDRKNILQSTAIWLLPALSPCRRIVAIVAVLVVPTRAWDWINDKHDAFR
jgi:hypothetical protein